jgi:hypothetical protein
VVGIFATKEGSIVADVNSGIKRSDVVVGKISQLTNRPGQTQPIGPRPGAISTGVAKAIAPTLAWPKNVVLGNTNDLGTRWFRTMIYSETDARKSVTAARFGSPEEVRIVLTRRKEQLTPLEDLEQKGYQFAEVTDEAGLVACITHPEAGWTDPTWVKNPNRTLVIDDLTEGVYILLDSKEVIDGKQVKNRMRSYDAAGKVLRKLIQSSFRAPQHIIMTATEKIKENPRTGNDRVIPELPPSMMSMVTTELEYVFYIRKGVWKFFTTTKYETYKDRNELTGLEEEFTREVFAKNKLPLKYKDAKILNPEEAMDLRAIWLKILGAKTTAAAQGAKK